VWLQVAQSLAKAINPNNATSATVSSTQAYNTASTFTAAAAKANRVQSSLSPQVCAWPPKSLCPTSVASHVKLSLYHITPCHTIMHMHCMPTVLKWLVCDLVISYSACVHEGLMGKSLGTGSFYLSMRAS
jgi:hypothetical protein